MKIPVLKMKYKQPESIRSVFHESAEKYGNKIAYKYFNNKNEVVEMTYKQLYSSFKYIGSILCELGLQKKKIAVIGENRPEWIIAYSAIMSIGSIVIPLDKELLEPQIEGFLNASEADAVFCSGKFAEKIQNMNLDKLQFIFDFDNSPSADKRCVAYSKLLSDGSRLVSDGLSKFNQVRYDRSKMSALIFTSGTTGTSKGVMLSEDNVLTALNAATNMIDLKSDNVLLSVLPMHHTYETTAGQLTAIRLGVTICINNSLKYVMRNMKLFKPTAMVVVPLYVTTIRKKISDEIRNRKKEKVVNVGVKATKALRKVGLDARGVVFSEVLSALGGRLKTIICGGAATNPDDIKWFEDIGINVYQGYGITECAPLVAVNPLVNVHYDSVGLPILGSRVKIISDESGSEVDLPVGEIGEICVKGGHVMLGYYNNEEATAAAFTEEGYFKTGDFGYMDEDGYLYITGRKKNIIILDNGKNVYPEEIEEYLERVEVIKECVVIGRENANGEVVITALIYPDYDMFKGCEESEIIDKMRNEVAKVNKLLPTFKQIRNIELKKTEFEKTTTKKIIRYKLS
ncbi:MAG: AMP-binding protein [Clostridia bacterium]|nr:AMP-binding protein [Clostridia bacterium]